MMDPVGGFLPPPTHALYRPVALSCVRTREDDEVTPPIPKLLTQGHCEILNICAYKPLTASYRL